MAESNNFLKRLQADYPQLHFRLGKKFTFRPPRTIIFEKPAKDFPEAVQNNFEAVQNDPRAAQDSVAEQNDAEIVQNNYNLQLLHELGHALLQHRSFVTDPERLKMERAAWDKARELAAAYNIYYDEDFAEAQLDTYRDWLHQKSRCPQCGLTRYQTADGKYHCPLCGQ